jgi:cytochrome c oxidase subunit IV
MPEDLSAHQGKFGGEAHASHQLVPIPVYNRVFWALMILLVITLVAAYFPLGALNLPLALAIAVAKAAIVVLYFMHVKYNSNLVKFFAVAALIWLAIMFVLTLSDYMTRGWLPQAGK